MENEKGYGVKLFREPFMSSLIHCIYSSVASEHFEEDELPELLRKARVANARIGITGMLAYINGHFLQIIEGEAEAVEALFEKIGRDPRHKRVFVLLKESITSRTFADWSMGFEALLPAAVDSLIGENDFFDTGSCVNALDPGVVKTILNSFRQSQTSSAAFG